MRRFLDGLSPSVAGLLQSAFTVLYIVFLSSVAIGNVDFLPDRPPFAPLFFLTLFVFSALLTSTLMLAYPLMLLVEGKRERAIRIVVWSIAWLFLALCAGVLYFFLF